MDLFDSTKVKKIKYTIKNIKINRLIYLKNYFFWQIEFFVYKCKDLENQDMKIQFIHNVISFIVGQVLQIQNILFCWAIIYLKSSEDILQNISKLDYLLKVSFF